MLWYCISCNLAPLETFNSYKQVECEYWLYVQCSGFVFSLGCISVDCFCVHDCKRTGSWPVCAHVIYPVNKAQLRDVKNPRTPSVYVNIKIMFELYK